MATGDVRGKGCRGVRAQQDGPCSLFSWRSLGPRLRESVRRGSDKPRRADLVVLPVADGRVPAGRPGLGPGGQRTAGIGAASVCRSVAPVAKRLLAYMGDANLTEPSPVQETTIMGTLLDKFRSVRESANMGEPVADAKSLEEISRVCGGRKIDPAEFFDDSPERVASRAHTLAAVRLYGTVATECQSGKSTDTSEPMTPVTDADSLLLTSPVSAGDAIAAADDVPVAESGNHAYGDPGASLTRNVEKAGLELRFPAKPGSPILANLKADGWRWSHRSQCWWRKDSVAARVSAWTITGACLVAHVAGYWEGTVAGYIATNPTESRKLD